MDAEHIVQPKMVYISNPTEYGTLYSLAELEALSTLCKKYRLYLFVDGARMGYGLTARENDITLAGAVHDFTCPATGKNYMYFPVKALE